MAQQRQNQNMVNAVINDIWFSTQLVTLPKTFAFSLISIAFTTGGTFCIKNFPTSVPTLQTVISSVFVPNSVLMACSFCAFV
ncbi:hypothetical protein DSO57_1013982 [Entomophthora muscae]|uniref:Uncharacterized protein n=1 Tax=Entomophthora muscae TaxID=34485 RepID=A0ACC2RWS9_9FUNG|nr:hypothetical protein DSO57_1013982 [Entomophthora muscae]